MFKLFDEETTESFKWSAPENISRGRENLGDEMPVFAYRLFQFTIRDELNEKLGKDKTIEIFRGAGERAGVIFARDFLDLSLPFTEFIAQLQKVLEENKIGVLRVENFDMETGNATLTVGEDLDCSGLPILGETVCNYDEGFLSGILKEYTKKEYIVTEIDCWATGARVCRFDAKVKR